MPEEPLYIELNMTAEEMYQRNPEYRAFQEADAQPMGVTFQGYNFPRYREPTVIIKYPNGTLSVDGVMSVLAYDDNKQENYQLSKINLGFLFNHEVSGISDKDAYSKMMSFFQELQDKGWIYSHSNDAPRLTAKDSFIFATTEGGSSNYLDYSYPLTFDEWMQLSDFQRWQLRYNTEAYMDIRINRQTDPSTGHRHYLISLDIYDELEEIKSNIDAKDRDRWQAAYSEVYPEIASWRLESESAAVKMGLKIQQDQPDYTLPLVLKETGIDTADFVSIDPYKITSKEFIERSDAGEDMTPYYENYSEKSKPDTTLSSRDNRRCLAGQPCPQSGY
ncbi:hypothetical protein [Psychrobacter sp. I-STPA10]|uniref:hypothetical protein n=1 Tax=Psychrobacter sp. I-STPA10 TaxID=2585769 RepID=UPI001E44823E|nr:hypothetical protein [Psychrobacter sp. I-STPA10]